MSQVLRFFRWLSILSIFAVLGLGCGEISSSDDSRPAPSAATHTFDRLVNLRLMVPTPEGNVELRSNEQLERILERHVPSETIRGRVEGEISDNVGQQINPNSQNPFIIAETVQNEGEPFPYQNILYNSKSQNLGGVFLENAGHAFGDEGEIFTSFSGKTTWKFKECEGTSADTKLGVVVGDLGSTNSPPIVSNGSGEIVVVVDWTEQAPPVGEAGDSTYSVAISVGGEQVFSASSVKRPSRGDGILPIFPVFESTVSGDYIITVEDKFITPTTDTNFGGANVRMRGLALKDPLVLYDLTPATPAVFSNSFQWDFGDNPTNLSQASWDIKITNPAGQTVTTLSGTGRTISTTWNPAEAGVTEQIRLHPKGQDSPDGGSPIYAYEIITRALAYDDASGFDGFNSAGPVAFEDVFYEVSSATTDFEVTLIDKKIVPELPFQNPGDTAELTAEIMVVGVEDLTAANIAWFVSVEDAAGVEVVKDLSSGTGFQLSATWDGKVSGVEVEDPRTYQLRIRVEVCGQPAVAARAIRAATTGPCFEPYEEIAQFTRTPALVFRDPGDTVDIGIGYEEGTETLIDEKIRNVRERNVYRYGPAEPEGAREVIIRARNLSFVDGGGNKVDVEPDQIKVKLEAVQSAELGGVPVDDILLMKTTVQGRTEYLSPKVTIPATLIRPDPTGLTTFSIGRIGLDTGGIAEAMEGAIRAPGAYPTTARVGVFDENQIGVNQATTPRPKTHEVNSNPDNIATGGFEALKCTIVEVGNPEAGIRTPNISAILKVPHRAKIVALNFHGNHKGSILPSLESDPLRDPKKNWRFEPTFASGIGAKWAGVETIIFAACDALDVFDYNNKQVRQRSDGTWPSGEVRPLYGGNLWSSILPNSVFLGYNNPGPYAEQNGRVSVVAILPEIVANYGVELAKFSGSDREQLAWLSANLIVGASAKGPDDLRLLAFNACAIDSQNYYYIPHGPGHRTRSRRGSRFILPDKNTVKKAEPVRRVPRSRWGADMGSWETNRETGTVVSELRIP